MTEAAAQLRPPVTIRRAVPDDARLILATWSRGTWQRPHRLRWQEHKELFTPLMGQLLSQKATKVWVAAGAHDYIYGWLAHSELAVPVLHWMYVKRLWREQGIARELLGAAGFTRDSELVYTAPGRVAKAMAGKAARAEFLTLREFLE